MSAVATQPSTSHIIDCDANGPVPDGWAVEKHQKGGVFTWDKEAQRNALYLSEGQADTNSITGEALSKELSGKKIPVLNANVLEYLLANQHLIPEEWEDKTIFFWGTVYRDRDGTLLVRCLFWDGKEWYDGYDPLAATLVFNQPAAVRAA